MRECGRGEIAELARLAGDRLGDLRVRVPQVRHIGAANRVEVRLAALVVQPAALSAHDPGVRAAELAVEDVTVRISKIHQRFSPRACMRESYGGAAQPAMLRPYIWQRSFLDHYRI